MSQSSIPQQFAGNRKRNNSTANKARPRICQKKLAPVFAGSCMQLRANPYTQNFPPKTCATFYRPHSSARTEMIDDNDQLEDIGRLSLLPRGEGQDEGLTSSCSLPRGCSAIGSKPRFVKKYF